MRFGLATYSAPATEPVTLDEARQHLRLDALDDAEHLARVLAAARTWVEDATNLALINRTLDLSLDCWPSVIRLPRAPVVSVTWIKYLDSDGTQQTLATDQYYLANSGQPVRIVPQVGVTWPSLRGLPGQVTVRFIAGHGTAGSSSPLVLRQAILLLTSHWYEQREAAAPMAFQSIPFGVEMLVTGWRMPWP
jgi:uncharacterized phiE125 gp8 family phage protein